LEQLAHDRTDNLRECGHTRLPILQGDSVYLRPAFDALRKAGLLMQLILQPGTDKDVVNYPDPVVKVTRIGID
jgi:hypothetical protein